jgi:hypothetical protein
VVIRGVRDRDKDRAACGGVSRTKVNDIGVRNAVDDGTRAERDGFVTSNVIGFPEKAQERLAPSAMRAGVSQGRGRAPSAAASATLVRMRSSQGA